jgi:protein involved in polysaccharide export with SLBB domain
MTDSEYEILRTRLAERREDFRVDWDRVRESPEVDIILRQGDIVRVDPLIASVRVDGEVRRPGIVTYDPDRTVDEYVELAGGYSKLASRSKVLITRAVTGQTLRARDVPSVSPADLIWVPEKRSVDFWGIFRESLAVAGQIAVIWVATR